MYFYLKTSQVRSFLICADGFNYSTLWNLFNLQKSHEITSNSKFEYSAKIFSFNHFKFFPRISVRYYSHYYEKWLLFYNCNCHKILDTYPLSISIIRIWPKVIHWKFWGMDFFNMISESRMLNLMWFISHLVCALQKCLDF